MHPTHVSPEAKIQGSWSFAQKGAVFGLLSFWAVWVVSAQAATLTPEEAQQKAAVSAYEKKLSPMEAWQKKIFFEEVVPQFSKFIRPSLNGAAPSAGSPGPGGTATGTSTASGTSAPGSASGSEPPVLDEELIRAHLSFYAPKVLQTKDAKILIFLQWPASPSNSSGAAGAVNGDSAAGGAQASALSDPVCKKCNHAEMGIRALARARSLRRGLQPVWVQKEDLSFPLRESMEHLDAKLIELMKQKEAAGALAIQWGPPTELGVAASAVPGAIVDPEAESVPAVPAAEVVQPLMLRLSLRFGERFIEKTKVLEPDDRFEAIEAILLNEVFSELGRAPQSPRPESAPGMTEKVLQVTGIRDFAQLTRIKNQLQNQIRDVVSVRERKISRGQVSLGVLAKTAEKDLVQQLESLTLDPGHEVGLSKEIEK